MLTFINSIEEVPKILTEGKVKISHRNSEFRQGRIFYKFVSEIAKILEISIRVWYIEYINFLRSFDMSAKNIKKQNKGVVRSLENAGAKNSENEIFSFFAAAFFSFFILIVFTDYTNITAVKYTCFCVMTVAVALFFFFSKLIENSDGLVKTKADFKIWLPYIFVGGYLLFNVLSVIFSPFKGVTNEMGRSLLLFGDKRYDGLLVIILYVVLFLVFSLKRGFGKHFLHIAAFTLAVTTFVGMIQFFGVNFLRFYPANNFYYYEKFISTLGNVDMVSAVYCLLLPIVAFGYITYEGKGFFKCASLSVYTISVFMFWKLNVDSGRVAFIVLVIAALNILYFKRDWYLKFFNILIVSIVFVYLSNAVVYSYDKSTAILSFTFDFGGILTYVSIIFAVLIFAIIYRYVITDKRMKTGFICLISVEILLFAVALWWVLEFADKSHGTIYEFAEILKGRGRNDFGSARYGLWKYTKEMADERPLIGYGTGTFRNNLAEFTTGISRRYSGGKFDFAHNEFLQIYYNCGIFGLLSYVGFIGHLIFGGIKKVYKSRKILILTMALICFFAQSFFMFSIIIVSPLFWIICGMLCYEINNT